jgi:hypothetical protein
VTDQKKCSNPACSCATSKGESFCSPHCESVKGATEIACQCGHPGCKGDTLTSK